MKFNAVVEDVAFVQILSLIHLNMVTRYQMWIRLNLLHTESISISENRSKTGVFGGWSASCRTVEVTCERCEAVARSHHAITTATDYEPY